MLSLFHFGYLAISSLLPPFAMSLTLNPPQNANASTTLTNPSSLLPSLKVLGITGNSNIKESLLLRPNTSTTLAMAKIECDDRRFGNPRVASCKNAVAQIPQDPVTIIRNPKRSYGPRGEGTWDVNLPKRYISCKTPSDAKTTVALPQVWLISDSGWAMYPRSDADIYAFSRSEQRFTWSCDCYPIGVRGERCTSL